MIYWADYLPVAMFLVLSVLLFSGYPVAFVLGGVALVFGLIGAAVGSFSTIEFFNIIPRIWGGTAENLVLVAVPCFIFMGSMLERSGIGENLLRILQVMLRRIPGGLALAVTAMATIMAATTGIIGASVTMMGLLALPTMLARRYDPELSAGTIAASSCLGILIPPSIMLVIMADLLGISVGMVFFSAVIPGLILAALYGVFIVVRTALDPSLAPPLARDDGPEGQRALWALILKGFLPPTVLVLMVLGSIFAGYATPTEAGAVGAFGALLLAAANRRLTRRILRDVVDRTAVTIGMIFFIMIGATAFSYVFRSLGGEFLIIDAIESVSLGSWGIMGILMVVVFLLGFFFDWIEITLIILPVFAPIIERLDFGNHLSGSDVIYWFTILMAVNLQTSFLTPPFGFALFFLKGVAPPELSMRQIYRGIVPFVILQLIGLALVLAFPQIALWLPHQMLDR